MKIAIWCGVLLSLFILGFFGFRAFQSEKRDHDLYDAVRQGDFQAVRELLDQGASPSGKPKQPPPLYVAIDQRETEIALALIRAGAAKDANAYVQPAIRAKNAEVLRELIRRGADVNRPTHNPGF